MKITIEFQDGSVWGINPETVIKHRDMFKKDSRKLFESDKNEALDWVTYKMDWSEIDAELIKKPRAGEYKVCDGVVEVEEGE